MRRLALLLAALLAAPVAGAQARPLLWTLADADSRVWLLGSFHALSEADHPLHPAVLAAYDSAEVVAFEIDPATMDGEMLLLMPRYAFTDRPLRALLPDSTYRALAQYLRTRGLSPADFDGMRPWAVAAGVAELSAARSGLDARWGVDATLHDRAVADGKPTAALETAEDQLAALAGGSDAEHAAALAETLAALPRAADDLAVLVGAWRAGDADALARLLKAGISGDPGKRLLTTRNRAWVAPVEALLAREGEDVLIVVGAGHLVGPDSLPALLAARGYAVTRVETP